MPAGMAYAIERGSKESTLEGQAFTWRAVLSGYLGEPAGPGQPGQALKTSTTVIAAGDGEFSGAEVNGTTITFETSDVIEIENDEDGVSNLTVDSFILYVRIDGTDYVVVPEVTMNVTLEPFQVLRITEITLGVNN